MRKIIYLALLVGVLMLPTSAFARFYVEGGVSLTSLDYHGHDNCRTVGPKFVFGWQALENISVEGHYMEGKGEEDDIDFEIQAVSLFAKVNLFTSCKPTGRRRAQLYGLFGYTQLKTRFPKRIPDSLVENETLDRTEEIDSFSIGGGFSFPILKRSHARIEYNILADDGFWHSSELSFRVGINF